ncbi:hypothetical protein Dimus_025886 [Dionaea muscipula]
MMTEEKRLEKSRSVDEAASGDNIYIDQQAAEEEAESIRLRTTETLLRLFPVGLCVAALVVMLKSSPSQTTSDLGSISYSTLGAFKYLVHANGICAGYSLVSAAVSAVPRWPSTMSGAWTLFLLDNILTYAILAAGAASTELVFLAYQGDDKVTWSAACTDFAGFCRKARASAIITLLVAVFYIAISFVSSYRLFSKFDPPIAAATAQSSNVDTSSS